MRSHDGETCAGEEALSEAHASVLLGFETFEMIGFAVCCARLKQRAICLSICVSARTWGPHCGHRDATRCPINRCRMHFNEHEYNNFLLAVSSMCLARYCNDHVYENKYLSIQEIFMTYNIF